LETKAIAQQSAGEKAQATELHWERFSSDFNQDKTQNVIWGGYEAFSYQLLYDKSFACTLLLYCFPKTGSVVKRAWRHSD
jgi:hypothetical protein